MRQSPIALLRLTPIHHSFPLNQNHYPRNWLRRPVNFHHSPAMSLHRPCLLLRPDFPSLQLHLYFPCHCRVRSLLGYLSRFLRSSPCRCPARFPMEALAPHLDPHFRQSQR
jgi:hypothetical protein